MPKTFFISDTHFSHINILKYEPIRVEAIKQYIQDKNIKIDFNVDEVLSDTKAHLEDSIKIVKIHNNMLVDKWNSVVSKDDIVWFLGDFGFGTKEQLEKWAKQLKGRKRMIMGNHDNNPESFYRERCGFEYVSRYPIILKGFFVLSHSPLPYMSDNIPFFNIFGHVHSNKMYQTKTDYSQCVCVERQNFEPIEIKEFNDCTDDDVNICKDFIV